MTTADEKRLKQVWNEIAVVSAAPPSQQKDTFVLCARRVAGLGLPKVEAVDRLWTTAVAMGLVQAHGEEAIQECLARAFDEPIQPSEDEPFTSEKPRWEPAESAEEFGIQPPDDPSAEAPPINSGKVFDFSFDNSEQDEFEDEVRPPAYSDEALALIFAERHSEQIKYVALWGKWLVWTGTHWSLDETLKVVDLARRVCREVASGCDDDKIARAVASRKAVSAVLGLARADERIAAATEDWDRESLLLNTPSAVVDLRSGKERPHVPGDYLTKITAVAPDPLCPIPLWQAFLERVTGGNVEYIKFLQRVCGYGLTGLTNEHALFFCYGTGANGKSTFVNTVTGCIGDYHRSAPIETFTVSNTERHPTELAALRGSRLVTAVETEEGRRWAESRIKSLTGGDKIAARFMRQDFFEFLPIFKLLIAGNHKPGLRSVDEAIRRRFHLLPFTSVIPKEERDLSFGDKLKDEWPGILAWMIEGCLDWQRQGLNPPAIVTAATAEYLEAEDSLAAWLDGAGDKDPNAFETTTDFFASWRKFAHENGEYVGSVRKFSQRLEERGASIELRKGRDSSGCRGFYGLRLRSVEPAASDHASATYDDQVPL